VPVWQFYIHPRSNSFAEGGGDENGSTELYIVLPFDQPWYQGVHHEQQLSESLCTVLPSRDFIYKPAKERYIPPSVRQNPSSSHNEPVRFHLVFHPRVVMTVCFVRPFPQLLGHPFPMLKGRERRSSRRITYSWDSGARPTRADPWQDSI